MIDAVSHVSRRGVETSVNPSFHDGPMTTVKCNSVYSVKVRVERLCTKCEQSD